MGWGKIYVELGQTGKWVSVFNNRLRSVQTEVQFHFTVFVCSNWVKNVDILCIGGFLSIDGTPENGKIRLS